MDEILWSYLPTELINTIIMYVYNPYVTKAHYLYYYPKRLLSISAGSKYINYLNYIINRDLNKIFEQICRLHLNRWIKMSHIAKMPIEELLSITGKCLDVYRNELWCQDIEDKPYIYDVIG